MKTPYALPVILVLCTSTGCGSTREDSVPVGRACRNMPGQVTAGLAGLDAGRTIGFAQDDLDDDGTVETVVITQKRLENGHPMGGEIIILQPVGKRLHPVWRQKKLNPWKVQIADVDGDHEREIAAGVWKKSPWDPVMAKRVFFYSWNGRRMLPKWLGSRLGRRFDDFVLADVNGDGWDELVALEVAPKGKRRVSVYRWLSFGFEWLGSSGDVDRTAAIGVKGGHVFTATSGGEFRLHYSKGKVRFTE